VTLTHRDFHDAVLKEFPELRGAVDDCNGLLHLEMGAFATFTQRAKGRPDWDTYKRAVRLITRLLERADPELRNAIHVSYLEHLDFEGPRGPTAWGLLPPKLQDAWKEIIAYDERLLGRPWAKTKPQ